MRLIPIAILLAVITVVVLRLPKIDVGHTAAFRRRRFFNWFPVGLTYAFLYMARYNLTAYVRAAGVSNADYGTIDQWGSIVYGVSFLLNGPLADRLGGKTTILAAAIGSGAMNVAMGVLVLGGWQPESVTWFTILYSANMYFQSFGAVSIVKVNSAWFHLRERGTFGGIFGILISLGLYFAYDWGPIIARNLPHYWVFFVPPMILGGLAVVDLFLVKDTPGQAGHVDFDTADASSGDTGERKSVWEVAKTMFSSRIIMVIAAIEFCSGFLRNAIMKWYQRFADFPGIKDTFVPSNWGLLLCCAGILGGVFAGSISDHVFQSRRGPVAAILYAGMLLGSGAMFLLMDTMALGWLVVFMSLCIIGVHGMLSGTASMDFGGKKNVGVAVGIIDGFVYLGTALQALTLKRILPDGEAAKDPKNWFTWPAAMAPVALVGLILALQVWNARAKGKSAPAAPAEPKADKAAA